MMELRRTVKSFIYVLALLLFSTVCQAEWSGVSYDHSDLTWSNSIVNGGNNTGGYAYSVTIANSQTLAVSHDLRGYFAQTGNDPINVWSAHSMCFGTYNVSTGDASGTSNIILKFNFSNAIESAQWTLPGIGVAVSGGGAVVAKYSFDGTTWYDAVSYLGNSGEQTVALTIPEPTSTIYIGWFGAGSSGNTAYFNTGGTGTLTVTAASNKYFSITGPAATFTDWAVAKGATATGFSTFVDPPQGNDVKYSGATNTSSEGTLDIPFSSTCEFMSAVMRFNSEVHSYDSNVGLVRIYIITDSATTLVYEHDSADYGSGAVYYNYNGVAPTGDGVCNTSTDISALIAGHQWFIVRFYSKTGWSGYRYNGGVFMVSNVGDFTLTGRLGDTSNSSTVYFNPPAGNYTQSQNVAIRCVDPTASIYYTTDGSDPSATNGTLITSGTTVTVDHSLTLKAVAVINGQAGEICSKVYKIVQQFSIAASSVEFTEWAISQGGTATNFSTFLDGISFYSGATDPSSIGTLDIPFTFNGELESATIYFNALVGSYGDSGSNSGQVKIYLITESGTTLIYQQDNPDYGNDAVYYNYNGAVSDGSTNWSGGLCVETSTDFSNLVRGQQWFILRFYSKTGWSSSRYNGGVFLDDQTGDGYFRLKGFITDVSNPTCLAFSQPSSTYYKSQNVKITAMNSSATIYYTTDGSDPSSTNGTSITSGTSVSISQNTTLKAVAAVNGAAGSIYSRSYTIKQPSVYTLDDEGRWMKDGNLFIPMMIYLPVDMDAIVDAGFNTVVMMGAGDPDSLTYYTESMDSACDKGLGVWVHVCEYFRNQNDLAGLTTVVNTLKNHPALEGWYLADEPSEYSTDPAVLATAAATIRSLDPNHPVIGLDNRPANFDEYAPAFDVFLPNPYPFMYDPVKEISLVTQWIDASRSVLAEGESLMVCLQTFGEKFGTRYPTVDEIWNMAYQSVVAGVKGISWWDQEEALASGGNWSAYQAMIPAMKTLMSYTVSSTSRTAYSGSGIYAALFNGKAGKVLVAVNTSSSSQSLTISVTASTAEALGSLRNAAISLSSNSIQLTMGSLGCGSWLLDSKPASTPGDFNGDGLVNATDIDLLFAAINNHSTSYATYDLTKDGKINSADMDYLITTILHTYYGDADLNHSVGVSDLSVLAAYYNTPSGASWANGDFDGNGAVGVSDLSILAANYNSGSASTVSWAEAYAQAFGTTSDADETIDASADDSEDTGSTVCSSLGLSLIAGLALMGLMMMKLEE
jgi:hypothetical protein